MWNEMNLWPKKISDKWVVKHVQLAFCRDGRNVPCKLKARPLLAVLHHKIGLLLSHCMHDRELPPSTRTLSLKKIKDVVLVLIDEWKAVSFDKSFISVDRWSENMFVHLVLIDEWKAISFDKNSILVEKWSENMFMHL
jgi:hypothetical protein